jgi:methyltransferase (TIGR00027 family)
MPSTASIIGKIEDTALWVAYYRATETQRPDAHFRDPYATLLAGERGKQLVDRMPGARRSSWPIVVRTCVFDEIIERLVQQDRIDTVINLAAGLDTRPYRMNLPSTLRWIEVDLPSILRYKEQVLDDTRPVCRLERVELDLGNRSARQKFFDTIRPSSQRALVVAEGLLLYLSCDQVASLASDLHAHKSFAWWLVDYVSPELLARIQETWGGQLAEGVRMQFAPAEGPQFYTKYGWSVAEFRSTYQDALRLKRTAPLPLLRELAWRFRSEQARQARDDMSGTLLLSRKNYPVF